MGQGKKFSSHYLGGYEVKSTIHNYNGQRIRSKWWYIHTTLFLLLFSFILFYFFLVIFAPKNVKRRTHALFLSLHNTECSNGDIYNIIFYMYMVLSRGKKRSVYVSMYVRPFYCSARARRENTLCVCKEAPRNTHFSIIIIQ